MSPESVDDFSRAESSSTHTDTTQTVFDGKSFTQPLSSFEREQFTKNYCDVVPHDLDGGYLYPALADNERLRLSTTWYLTNGLLDEPAELRKMQDKIDVLKALTGWEYVICGILDSDIYQRVVTVGLPLNMAPRRENLCAHTVLQPRGNVLYLPDMTKDWRFQHSPPVKEGGFTSYAGVPLQHRLGDGQDVALGGVCLATRESSMQLSQDHLDLLPKFADMMVNDILSASQRRRAMQQAKNDSLLMRLVAEPPHSLTEDAVLALVKISLPDAHITVQSVSHGTICIEQDHPAILHPNTATQQLWEDHAFIDQFIRTRNHERSKMADHFVRAIVTDVQDDSTARALVIATADISRIFDEVDLRFAASCSLILSSIISGRALQTALATNDRFMREVAHHLRTPIHGILASAELLRDELLPLDTQTGSTTLASSLENLDRIEDSGKELERIVNSIIRLDQRITLETYVGVRVHIMDANMLETQILEAIPKAVLRTHARSTCVYFDSRMPSELRLVLVDKFLIRDCLQPLLVNALQNTPQGSVLISCSASEDYSSMTWDIRDTGCGIASADELRIFDSYETVQDGKQGLGLGLTLSRRIAQTAGGTVDLISSRLGEGSHFRVVFNNCVFASTRLRTASVASFDNLPKQYYCAASESTAAATEAFSLYLEARGLTKNDTAQHSLVLVPYSSDQDDFDRRLARSEGGVVAVSLVPHQADLCMMETKYPSTLFLRSPFTTTRLAEILRSVNDVCGAPVPHSIGDPTTRPPTVKRLSDKTRNSLSRHDYSVVSSTSLQCLLVDDNLINLRILTAFCKRRSFPYREAFDGLQAIDQYKQAAQKSPISLILLDLQMPNCNGIEACKSIREYEASNNLAPAVVIIVTGQDTPEDRKQAAEAGADDYFVKPLAMQKLDQTIRQCFELTILVD